METTGKALEDHYKSLINEIEEFISELLPRFRRCPRCGKRGMRKHRVSEFNIMDRYGRVIPLYVMHKCKYCSHEEVQHVQGGPPIYPS